MKKTISAALSVCLMLTVFLPAVYALRASDDGVYPTVMVAGYSSSDLYLQTEDGAKKVWGVDINQISQKVLHNIARIGRGLGDLAFGHPEYIADMVGKAIVDMYGILAYTPEGESLNPILPYAQDGISKAYDIAATQHRYLNEFLDGKNIHEREISATLAELNPNGDAYVYSFQSDFRQNIVDIAADLDRFIEGVCEQTGEDKINLFAVSHGGETCAVYLNLYGEKNRVHNAVLTVPAIGGAALAYDVMSENVRLDEETLLYFIEDGNMIESDINWLVRADQLGILDAVCNLLVRDYVKKILGNWGSMWDFIPAEYYDELKAQHLDPVANAKLIEKSDYYHYEILPSMHEKLTACVDNGANIYIVAGSDLPSVTGLQEQSDAIITVSSSTGSYTAPYGLRFADGFQAKGIHCDDPSHNHVSPAMTVDASTGYLPEYTWFVNGLFHGMTWKDPYAKALCCKLIASDSRIDVHTDPAFPQFKYAENNSYSVLPAFNRSAEGTLSAADNGLVVKNLSQKYPMRVVSVSCNGTDLQFDLTRLTYIAPGKTKEIPMKGTVPQISGTTADVTVTYSLIGSVTPLGTRTCVFTIDNGARPAYDESQPFVTAQRTTFFESGLSDTSRRLLQKTSLFDFLKMVINSMIAICRMFRSYWNFR